MTPSVAAGLIAWVLSHSYAHWRCAALERGDLEALAAGDIDGSAPAIERGIEIGTVSPEVAEALGDRRAIPLEMVVRTRSGAYRRRYDRTLASDLPWLPVFILAAALGWRVGGACAAFCLLLAAAAHADARFRVIPVGVAAAMMAGAPFSPAVPELIPAACLWLAGGLGLLAVAKLAAGWMSVPFGAGDVILLATTTASLMPIGGVLPYLAALASELALALAIARMGGAGTAREATVPLAAAALPPYLLAIAVAST